MSAIDAVDGSSTLASIGEDDVTLTADDWELDAATGELWRLDGADRRVTWPAAKIVVAYAAGCPAHQRALPRLYDELNSSHLTVHGATDQAIAAGFAMVNISSPYLSPDLNKQNRAAHPVWSTHDQPRDAQLAIDKVRQLPRRSRTEDTGYDALSIVVIECVNDGSRVNLVETPPAPQAGDIYHYASMIDRLSHIYATRFKDL